MKALLVTSQTTFVPRNYDDVIVALAAQPQVGGLLVLRNRHANLALKAVWLIGCGAWRLGTTLLLNLGPASHRRRAAAFARYQKPVWTWPTINSALAVEVVKENGFDLIVNARTRERYKEPILAAPPLGCINIHHGLLPEQRGTMCDLWALSEGQPAGFTIHAMTAKIDAGGILTRCPVSEKHDRHYPRYLQRACGVEAREMACVLAAIEAAGRLVVHPNPTSKSQGLRRNPNREHLRRMIRKGLRL